MNDGWVWDSLRLIWLRGQQKSDVQAKFTESLDVRSELNRPLKMDSVVSRTYCALVHIVVNSNDRPYICPSLNY
jgi:hypothetical protein